MRSLNTRIKADFIRKESSVTGSNSSADSFVQHCSDTHTLGRPKSGQRSATDGGSNAANNVPDLATIDVETPKKSRPRSLTFTRSKNDATAKKERPVSHSRTKSSDASSSRSLTSPGAAQGLSFMNRTPKAASPGDYIAYLQKVRQPQAVEVGRIQKLRQLLRNETVSWVETFIEKGGMTEVVGLLYRILEIEWRYVFASATNIKPLIIEQGRA